MIIFLFFYNRQGIGKTYHFVFRHRPSFSSYEKWSQGDHREGIIFWLDLMDKIKTFVHVNLTEQELKFVQDMLNYQANFIKTG